MSKEIFDLTDDTNNSVIVVKSQITHISVLDSETSLVHFVSGKCVTVAATINELVSKIWPLNR